MKLKRFLLLFLASALCFGLTACDSDRGEAPEVSREDLASMTDKELIPVLLDSYADYEEPLVFSAEMSWVYRSGESVVAEMEGVVRRNGSDRMMERTCTVGEEVKTERYVYKNGVCYIHDGSKIKAEGTYAEVSDYFAERCPVFGKVDDYNFVAKDLLCSDDGSYSLVLFLPANSIADSADIISPLTAAGNETAPVTMSDFSDIYLTLRFSSEGKLTGQTLGFDCSMNADGIETEGSVLLRFSIVSTSATQLPVSAPEDESLYSDGKGDLFSGTDSTEPEDSATDSSNGSSPSEEE